MTLSWLLMARGPCPGKGCKGAFVYPPVQGCTCGERSGSAGYYDRADRRNLEEADYALGIILREDACPPQPQSLNVVFTWPRTSTCSTPARVQGLSEYPHHKEEYDAIYEATGRKGCSFGSPIRIDFPEAVGDGTGPAFAKVNLPWLRRRIEEGSQAIRDANRPHGWHHWLSACASLCGAFLPCPPSRRAC